jgi:flagellar biosynthesis anti-sigma factor FlgM
MNKLEPTLKISRNDTVNESAKGNSKPKQGKASPSKELDRVTLSETSKSQATASGEKVVSSGIRQDLVNKFRDVLQKGSYEVKANEIADKIVQKIRENKNHLVL